MNSRKNIIIASDGDATQIFIDGKVYGEHITKFDFHCGGYREVSMTAEVDDLPVEGNLSVEGFKELLRYLIGESAQSSEVETVEELNILGERRIITLLDGKEINNVVIGADGKESIKLEDVVDSTIESICERIQKNDMLPEEYTDTLKALAALVEARARLNQR